MRASLNEPHATTNKGYIMKNAIKAGAVLVFMQFGAGSAGAAGPNAVGGEEFGMSERELVQAVTKVETLISQCMRKQGFSYVAADFNTVRNGMVADKHMRGMSEEQFVKQHGFGVATLYTGHPPQLATGYSPGKVGLGERNVELYKKLPAADQAAYNRALFGEDTGETFAVALEKENFAMTGGCTREAIGQVFKPDQVKATYYNPKDALVNKDPRMQAALRKFSAEMKKAGYSYNHPDEVEADIRTRLAAITGGSSILVDKMEPAQQAALKELQDYERRVAAKTFALHQELVEPVEEKILNEMFARQPK
jgi:hypothetical protein